MRHELFYLSKLLIFYVAFSFSCGRSHLLERVCEVDLEACQLLIHGFLLNKNGSYISEGEESQTEEIEDMEDVFLTSKWEQSNCFSVNSSKQKSFRHSLIGKKHQSTPCELKEVSFFFLFVLFFQFVSSSHSFQFWWGLFHFDVQASQPSKKKKMKCIIYWNQMMKWERDAWCITVCWLSLIIIIPAITSYWHAPTVHVVCYFK